MVQDLMVECPHCHQIAEIFLSTNACVIILNCPACSSPMMYFDHKIFILTPQQLQTIKNKNKGLPSLSMLRNMFREEQEPVQKPSTHLQRAGHMCPKVPPVWENTLNISDPFKIIIGDDDITNLKIDLGISRDVLEFVAVL